MHAIAMPATLKTVPTWAPSEPTKDGPDLRPVDGLNADEGPASGRRA